jgi:hypothetical protein
MLVERIEAADGEAEVIVTDGQHHCLAYCHSCELSAGESIPGRLHVLEHGNICVSRETKCGISRQSRLGHFNQWFVARVEDRVSGLVSVGKLCLDGLRLPGDIKNGELVEFAATRVDIFGAQQSVEPDWREDAAPG